MNWAAWILAVLAAVYTVLPAYGLSQNELAAIADRDIWFLSPGTFEERTKTGMWLVYFGTTWCPYCKKLTPKWLEVQKVVEAEHMADRMFSMAKVDCTAVGQWCGELKVTGFPNIFLYMDGVNVDLYPLEHETPIILKYIQDKLAVYEKSKVGAAAVGGKAPPSLPEAGADPADLKVQNRDDQKPLQQPPVAGNLAVEALPAKPDPPAAAPVPPVAKAPLIPPVENQPLNKGKEASQDPKKAAGPIQNEPPSGNQKQAVVGNPEELVDDGMTNTTVKGTRKHPIKEFRGLRGFIQSRLVTPLVGPEFLGFGLVAGGAVIKMPQIYKIVMKRSAIGVSFASYALETAAYIAGLAYNVRQGNPFNTYGEHAFMAVANCIVIALMFHYTHRYKDLVTVSVCTFLFTTSLFSRAIINDTLLLSFQWLAILIGIVSKLPQIYSNWNHKSCGQLSAVTVGLQTVGSLARCFTTATEVKDTVIFVTYLVATGLNGSVLYQVVIYWGKGRKTKSLMD